MPTTEAEALAQEKEHIHEAAKHSGSPQVGLPVKAGPRGVYGKGK